MEETPNKTEIEHKEEKYNKEREIHKKVFYSLVIILIGTLFKYAFDTFVKNSCFADRCSLPSIGIGGFLSILIYTLIRWRI